MLWWKGPVQYSSVLAIAPSVALVTGLFCSVSGQLSAQAENKPVGSFSVVAQPQAREEVEEGGQACWFSSTVVLDLLRPCEKSQI